LSRYGQKTHFLSEHPMTHAWRWTLRFNKSLTFYWTALVNIDKTPVSSVTHVFPEGKFSPCFFLSSYIQMFNQLKIILNIFSFINYSSHTKENALPLA
jgi:hypothetical protein